MRIMTFDAVRAAASIVATPAMIASVDVTNLNNASRSRIARAVGTTQSIVYTWTLSRQISGVAMGGHNLSPSATWRIRLYADAAQTQLLYDSGATLANPPKPFESLLWGEDPLGATIFEGWEHRWASLWFSQVLAQSMIVDFADPANEDGYIELTWLLADLYQEFEPEYGIEPKWNDTSRQRRTVGGSLVAEPGAQFRSLSMEMKLMRETERQRLSELSRKQRLLGDIFISVYPEEVWPAALRRDNEMLAKITEMPGMPHTSSNRHSSRLVVQES
jgi:hypothetical protein